MTAGGAEGPTRAERILSCRRQVLLIAQKLHARLPVSVALDDLIAAGTLGAIAAVDSFDPARGQKLKTYAEPKIRGAMLDSLREIDWLSRNKRRDYKAIVRAGAELAQERQREPTEAEIAERLGIPLAAYQRRRFAAFGILMSLETKVGRYDIPLEDMLEAPAAWPDELAAAAEQHRALRRALGKLAPRERTILELFYMEGLTQTEIARALGTHASRISQLQKAALERLRRMMLRPKATLRASRVASLRASRRAAKLAA
jgi:RNA polymerase sigma factor for flagellar operon FliA